MTRNRHQGRWIASRMKPWSNNGHLAVSRRCLIVSWWRNQFHLKLVINKQWRNVDRAAQHILITIDNNPWLKMRKFHGKLTRKCLDVWKREFTIEFLFYYIAVVAKFTSGSFVLIAGRGWLGSNRIFLCHSMNMDCCWSLIVVAGSLPHFLPTIKTPGVSLTQQPVHLRSPLSSFQVVSSLPPISFLKCPVQCGFSTAPACRWFSTWLCSTVTTSPSKELKMDHPCRPVLTWSPLTASRLRTVLHPSLQHPQW